MPARQPFTQLCSRLSQIQAEAQRADLHIHSHFSDGDFSPTEVVRRARQRGLGTIALTDHDTTAGVAEAQRLAASLDGSRLEVIPGVEITCEWQEKEVHLLAYFVRLDDTGLTSMLDKLAAARRSRFSSILERLHEQGIVLSVPEIPVCPAPGRRNVARLLVQQGHLRSIGSAFGKWLGDQGPLNLPKLRWPIADAIQRVHDAGGITSLAHPPPHLGTTEFTELHRLGLDALEAAYPAFAYGRVQELRAIARVAGLAITGGSDCHGTNPNTRAIGSWGINRAELDELRRRCAITDPYASVPS